MIIIKIFEHTGDFAENKDIARDLRKEYLMPSIGNGDSIVLDFDKVTSATQSFVHALISQIIREFGPEVLDRIHFRNCASKVKTIVQIVVEYVQDGIFSDESDEDD